MGRTTGLALGLLAMLATATAAQESASPCISQPCELRIENSTRRWSWFAGGGGQRLRRMADDSLVLAVGPAGGGVTELAWASDSARREADRFRTHAKRSAMTEGVANVGMVAGALMAVTMKGSQEQLTAVGVLVGSGVMLQVSRSFRARARKALSRAVDAQKDACASSASRCRP